MKKGKCFMLLFLLMISMLALAACGGSGNSKTSQDAENAAEGTTGQAEASETDFLLGTWFAKECTQNDKTADPADVFGGKFYLWFGNDGDCQICIDQKRAPVTWEYTGDGVTLKGDNTYQITFPDNSRKTMIITINGIDTLMEKFEKGEEDKQ